MTEMSYLLRFPNNAHLNQICSESTNVRPPDKVLNASF